MDYKKRLNRRMYLAIGYIVIGVVLTIISLLGISDSEMLTGFGAAFGVCGIARIVQNLRIRSNEDIIHQREIAEKDERNIMLWEKARSRTFGIYISVAGIAIVVLCLMQMEFIAQIIAYTVCALAFIYWICYMIISRKY